MAFRLVPPLGGNIKLLIVWTKDKQPIGLQAKQAKE
jgi:hypothetical protein